MRRWYNPPGERWGAVIYMYPAMYNIALLPLSVSILFYQLRAMEMRSVVVNYNPETVSTDYDESDV